MDVKPFGDKALLISFEKKIDPEVNQMVINLYHTLKASRSFTFLTPAYCSLTVGIDRTRFTMTEATELIRDLATHPPTNQMAYVRDVTIPVCYEPEFAPDMAEVSRKTGLTEQEIIQKHTETTYRVYMLGFVAGFAYLGTLPEPLVCDRKETPRKLVPKGSVGLAGHQTGIYPVDAPGGWQIIGQTPLNMFDTSREEPNLLFSGDKVKFRAVSADEFKLIALKQDTGIYTMEARHGE
ncbi:5-oxoprolinase subunit PxpB [Roseivirga sp.]|uniref:5-oxoprolinase subunit PxpB n=1 Tax=Roseivirga sp. TaxID=1964215 RepID=UPI003B5185A6